MPSWNLFRFDHSTPDELPESRMKLLVRTCKPSCKPQDSGTCKEYSMAPTPSTPYPYLMVSHQLEAPLTSHLPSLGGLD